MVTVTNRDMNKQIANIVHHAEVSEKEIEKYLNRRAKEAGLLSLKYSNAMVAGYPDRLLVLPGSKVVWVELKSRGKKPTRLQLARHAELQALGHQVHVIDNKNDIDNLIATLV